MRTLLSLSLATLLLLPGLARANTSHHSSGGGGGSLEGACIRWEPVVPDGGGADMSQPSDGGLPDGGLPDGGGGDMGPNTLHIGERCVEHASLFGCSIVTSATRAPVDSLLALTCAGASALLLLRLRRAR